MEHGDYKTIRKLVQREGQLTREALTPYLNTVIQSYSVVLDRLLRMETQMTESTDRLLATLMNVRGDFQRLMEANANMAEALANSGVEKLEAVAAAKAEFDAALAPIQVLADQLDQLGGDPEPEPVPEDPAPTDPEVPSDPAPVEPSPDEPVVEPDPPVDPSNPDAPPSDEGNSVGEPSVQP